LFKLQAHRKDFKKERNKQTNKQTQKKEGRRKKGGAKAT
jgi:hypothetical protein